MRLDIFLVKKEFVESRNKAKQLILKGSVCVNGQSIKKASFNVDESYTISISNPLKYVSRAGLKLEKAFDQFNININERICLDVGSSTGGFTDCMLKRGASKVYAVDVGKDQLHSSLRKDKRVFLFEKTDIRVFYTDTCFDFAAVDVSFISLELVLNPTKRLLKRKADLIALIKPQFEVGKGNTKKGIVKDVSKINFTIKKIKVFAQDLGFVYKGLIESPIRGKEGNKEFLMWLKNG